MANNKGNFRYAEEEPAEEAVAPEPVKSEKEEKTFGEKDSSDSPKKTRKDKGVN